MLSPTSSPRDRHGCSLPDSVEALIRQICARHSQRLPDPKARALLGRLGEEAALRVLQPIAESRTVRNLSAFIVHMVTRGSPDAMARNAVGISTAESACFSGPRASIRGGEESVASPPNYSGIQMEVESPVRPMAFGPPTRDSTPSPVRELSKHVCEMTGAVAEMAVATPVRPETGMPLMLASNGSGVNPLRETASPQMLALGELEFRKAFLILSYLPGQKLEGVLSVEYIRSLKSLGMADFESAIWSQFGHHHIAPQDRRKNLDWDRSKTHMYHCYVDIKGKMTFKGPYLENTRTHLQRIVGDDNILLVKFADISEESSSAHAFNNYCDYYHPIAEDGIVFGLRRYRFFLYKDGGKAEKKKDERTKCATSVRCYFVLMESGWDMDEPYILSNKTIRQARNIFMHAHTTSCLAKYMARFALILSKTIKLDVDLSTVDIRPIEDKPCKDEDGNIVLKQDGEPMIHTDGTGFISEDLALKCPTNIFKGNFLKSEDLQNILDCGEAFMGFPSSKKHRSLIAEYPLLMQFRMFHNGFAVKGTLLVNKQLPPRTICVRPSMTKVEADPEVSDVQSCNSLEIVTTSNRPKRVLTSRYLIALLHYGGVPAEYFMELLMNALEKVQNARYNARDALKVAVNYADMDDSIAARMILSGVPLNEPYLQSYLVAMTKMERNGIKGGKLPIDECYYLMGTSDPTGLLKPNEVCVILEHGQLSGDVLVYKHPGLHFGDIHVVTATYIKDLERIVGNAKYAIFFPTTGRRSLADEMANSDFDGDIYWISRNPQLLKYFKPSEPWVRRTTPRKLNHMRPEKYGKYLERSLFHEFLKTRFEPSYAMGTAADCWLVYMDRLLTCKVGSDEKKFLENKMLNLVDYYYEALDAPKNGRKVEVPKELKVKKYPHFMERKEESCYHSTSILGVIYDKATTPETGNIPPSEIWLLPCFEEELSGLPCYQLWMERHQEYLRESRPLMNVASKEYKNMKFEEIYQNYKLCLYGAPEFEARTRAIEDVFTEACAIYQIAYNYARNYRDVHKCGFAWRVAGRALCHLYALKQGGETLLCSLPVLREVLLNQGT